MVQTPAQDALRFPQRLTFGELLRQHRKARRLTQAELAERAGLSMRGINDLERGVRSTPRRDTVALLAVALELEAEERAAFLLAARPATPAPVPLGAFRSLTPISLSQQAGQPSPLTPPATDRHAHNLPIQPTRLLGREREVAEIVRLLCEGAWLVTVTGPPGVGKTRLSLQVAAELAGASDLFPDGVWFVRLSRLRDPTLVIATIAHELGLREGGARPISEVLDNYLEPRRLLLVIDNFEHVAAAASDLAELRQRCAGVRLLVSSRSPLRLRGEREFALAALPVPAIDGPAMTLEQLVSFASIRLFSERAQAAVAEFALTSATAPVVAMICARLDGLPLALELAATRIKVLPLDTLLARLERALPLLSDGPRDVDERQRTMRATLAWSEELLGADDRALFRRLAVFAGGATLEAVEEVCLAPDGAPPLNLNAFTGLAALIDQSLIQRREEGGEPRYGMLHVIREYALERLEASGEAEPLRRTHALACLRLGEEYGPGEGLCHPKWVARMGAERDNLRAALAWALEYSEAEIGLRLATVFAGASGDVREKARWLTEMFRLDEVAPQSVSGAERDHGAKRQWARRWALLCAADCYLTREDRDRCAALLDEALQLSRAAGDQAAEFWALYLCIPLLLYNHDEPSAHAEAGFIVRQLIESVRTLENDHVKIETLTYIGWHLICLPDGRPANRANLAEAIALTDEGISLARRCGDPLNEFVGSGIKAGLCTYADDMTAARAAVSRSLDVVVGNGYEWTMGNPTLNALAGMAVHEGRAARAARLLGAQVALEEAQGFVRKTDTSEILVVPPGSLARARLGDEPWSAQYAAGKAMSRDEVLAEAWREARGEPE